MGYANPQQRITYSWTGMDFGVAADVASSFQGPKGLTGKLVDIIVVGTEVFTAGGTISIGTGGDADAYALAALGTLPATDTFTASQDDTDAIIESNLPADTQVEVVFGKVSDGAGGTGIGNVHIVVEWF